MLSLRKWRESGGGKESQGSLRVLQAPGPKEIIEDYLDYICLPLVGIIPFEERSRIREEALFHIEELQQSLLGRAESPAEAARLAVKAYGHPAKISDECLESYLQNRIQSPVIKRIGTGNFIAFSIFGVAQMFYTAILNLHVFLPSGEAYRLPVTPAEARMLIPEPFPIPQSWGDFALLYGFAFIAPLVAGFLSGICIPVNSSRSVFLAMMPLIIYSFVVGSFMVPLTAGLLFAIFQAVYWVPAGCLLACLGSTLAHRYAIRRKRLAIFGSVDER